MRWKPDARGRLQRAAFDLFSEQGYADTTVPQITTRAGLTTRTFFRYFADKREVIFGGTEIPDMAAQLVRDAPEALTPDAVLRLALCKVAAQRFDGHKDEIATWRSIINRNSELRDRDARKRADLVLAIRDAFVARGESHFQATLYAEVAALVFHVALDQWLHATNSNAMEDFVILVLHEISVVEPDVIS